MVVARLALCLLLFLAPEARADALLGPNLPPGQSLHGRFLQQRHLTGLNSTLTTEGDFLLVPSKGLIWRSTKPFVTTTIITATGIRQLVNGNEVQRLAAARLPFIARLYDMLGGTLAGNWSAMTKDFKIEQTGSPAAWDAELTPARTDDALAGQLSSIKVTGGRLVDQIEIHRPNGDWEQIKFLDQSMSAAAPSDADAALLEDKDQ
jgi:hypothetical protein